VVAGVPQQDCLGYRLPGPAAHPADPDEQFAAAVVRPAQLLRRQPQDRLEQADGGFADGELRRVDADGQPADPRVGVVADQRPLPPLVQLAVGRERQRHRRDRQPAAEGGVNVCRRRHEPASRTRVQNAPSRASKWVGLPRSVPPAMTQRATHEI
jgi:hypothetical protein